MKRTKKNEELQSRREFFKSAAKGALPILALTVLGPGFLSSCEKEKEKSTGSSGSSSGCGKSCSGGCDDGCTNNCDDLCGGDCWAYCESKYKS